jgi:prefoldin subunit 5
MEAAADTFEESKLERLEAELESVDEDIKDLDAELQGSRWAINDLRVVKGEDITKLKELSVKYGRFFLGGKVTERGQGITAVTGRT